MRFNNLWITFTQTMDLLLNFNKRVKQLDARIQALDARIIILEGIEGLPPGTDVHNDFDMVPNINKIKAKVDARIE